MLNATAPRMPSLASQAAELAKQRRREIEAYWRRQHNALESYERQRFTLKLLLSIFLGAGLLALIAWALVGG